MADVAQLGIAVDSSQVKSATAALNQLNQASASAQRGAEGLTQSSKRSETAMRAIEAAAKRSHVSVEEMTRRVDANSAAQIKMGTASATAVKGMQQLSQQATKASNDNKALGEQTEKTTGSLEKFATRFMRGFIAGIAIQAVRDLTQYVMNLNAALAATADTAQRIGVGGQQFQGLQTAAGYKGIAGADFASAMLAFNQQVDQARNGLGSLQVLLRANGSTVSDTATTFGRVADLVRNAGSEAQKFSILQQAGLPATREFARLMEQGSGSLNKAVAASAKVTDQQLADAQRVNDKWNEIWTNFENWGKRAIVNVFSALSGGQERAPFRVIINGGTQLPQEKTKPTVDPELLKQQNSLAQQRLAILGPLLSVEDQVRQKELELAAAGLNLYGVNTKQRDALLNLTRAQAEWTMIAGQASIGVFNLRDASAQAGHELQGWIGRRLLDPNNAQQMAAAHEVLAKRIDQTRDAARLAAAPLEGLQRLANEAGSMRGQFDTLATGTLNGLSDGLVSIANRSATAGDAFRNFSLTVVTALQKMIVQMTIIKPLADALQSSMGGGGFLSFLGLGGPSVGTTSATAGASSFMMGGQSFPMFAHGGTLGAGWGVVGERGPELINVHSRGVTVIPNHLSRPYLPGFAEGGSLSASGNVIRLPFRQQDNSPSILFGDINISVPEGTSPENAAAIGQAVKASVQQAVDERLGYHMRNRGMLNRAS